jgi:hypothetical protein
VSAPVRRWCPSCADLAGDRAAERTVLLPTRGPELPGGRPRCSAHCRVTGLFGVSAAGSSRVQVRPTGRLQQCPPAP